MAAVRPAGPDPMMTTFRMIDVLRVFLTNLITYHTGERVLRGASSE